MHCCCCCCCCCCCEVVSVVSESVWPHGRQPTRPRSPWGSPGKNTGVGCHVLLQCMKVKCESEVAQSCPTLSDPMDCSLPGSSVHEIFQARVLEWGAIAFSHIYSQACLNHWLLATFGMPMTTQPYQATEERKHLTTGGPGKEQGTNKLPPTRILQRSTRGQQEMGDCSPEVLATSSEQQRPSIVKTNSMLPKTNK